MSADIDCVVIGAGVVGLAIARALALRGREVLVAEATEAIGTGTSSRNSEVIHAGIYYPYRQPESPAVRARQASALRLLRRARRTAQAPGQADRGHRHGPGGPAGGHRPARGANGVDDLQYISGEEAMRLEPALRCTAALLSPSTGIVDSHALMLSYQGDAENAGAQCVFHTPLESGRVRPEGGFELRFGGADAMRLSCNILINAAGLRAPALARRIDGVPAASIPASYLCKGSYFTLS
ncbi:FAD-dependent oxidoreductase [Achromobacter xylosoxidans]